MREKEKKKQKNRSSGTVFLKKDNIYSMDGASKQLENLKVDGKIRKEK